MLPGVYEARKKDHTLYYRSSITWKRKHISLGSFPTEQAASQAYEYASRLLSDETITLPELCSDYTPENASLSFEKIVSLINFRDNHLYIGNPVYLKKGYFIYYLSPSEELKFDIDDLFYYSSHKILRRKGHLYVNDYGMQVTILSRYGVRAHAVCGKDYLFVNGDCLDFRYSNIKVVNPYYGVTETILPDGVCYTARIHINGSYTLGRFSSVEKAAAAYNKAVDLAHKHGIGKNFPENYIETLSASEYAEIYTNIRLSQSYLDYLKGLPS